MAANTPRNITKRKPDGYSDFAFHVASLLECVVLVLWGTRSCRDEMVQVQPPFVILWAIVHDKVIASWVLNNQ